MSKKLPPDLKIAIDGPGGAGKSSVARELARRFKLKYLDTGAMYRAATLKLIREDIDLDNTEAIESLLDRTVIKPGKDKVYLDGDDVSEEIRRPYINELVSRVSAISAVRRKMVRIQQQAAMEAGGIVMEGRDIATRVIPGADFKFYLDAGLPERARRRRRELLERGIEHSLDQVAAGILERDRIDTQRADSPLQVSGDSIVVDTTALTFEQVVGRLVEIINSRKIDRD